MNDFLLHYGIPGMHWGIRKAGKSASVVFVSGSSKTQDKTSPYYRKKLPKEIRRELKKSIKNLDTFVVGDAPGIDRQVQQYLNEKRYKNVEVYGPGTEIRYSANKKWKTYAINDPKHAPMSPEWLRKKDIAMTKRATKGLAVILDNGAQATRNNIKRLKRQKKEVRVYSLNQKIKDGWVK